ncbi:MAG: hypothetical protein ACHQKY_06420 [Terriglobia bacterium]
MFRRIWIAALFLILCSPAWGQNLSPQKDLAFSQIAAGGGYETVLVATNRGTTAYTGVLNLFRAQGQAWNPIVNGTSVVNGQVSINIPAGGTTTLHITGAAGTEAGFGFIKAADPTIQTATLEGNLTFYVKAGSTVNDSVGVPPSNEFYLATIPFEDSTAIALALANLGSTSANVRLSLFNDTNGPVNSPLPVSLSAHSHLPQFLNQFFPGLTLGKGRLEIESDVPIVGTALTLVSNQLSSLPLLPSQRTFSYSATFSGGVGFTGDGGIWVNGSAVNGYLRITGSTPPILGTVTPETYFVFGALQNKTARIMGYGKSNLLQGQEFIVYTQIDNFSLSASTLSGSIMMTSLTGSSGGTGTIQITRIN